MGHVKKFVCGWQHITAASGVILPADKWFGSAALRRDAKAGKTNAKPQNVTSKPSGPTSDMKKTLFVILSLYILTSCTDINLPLDTSMTKEKQDYGSDTNDWTPIDIKTWYQTPSLNSRIATEDDVKSGLAVYCIKNGGPEHTFYKTKLPKLAYWTDSETNEKELVVVVQIETTAKDTVAGYRNLGGRDGACMLYELILLDDKKIKEVVGQ